MSLSLTLEYLEQHLFIIIVLSNFVRFKVLIFLLMLSNVFYFQKVNHLWVKSSSASQDFSKYHSFQALGTK